MIGTVFQVLVSYNKF